MNKEMEEAQKILDEAAASANPQPKLQLIAGGKDGGGSTGNIIGENPDWLTPMKLGSAFLISEKNGQDFNLGQFQKLLQTDNNQGVFLWSGLQKEEVRLWVNPLRFCNKYRLVAILPEANVPVEGEVVEEPLQIEDQSQQ